MEPTEVFALMMCTAVIGFVAGGTFSMLKDARYEHKIIQCLSQSGTTWQGGECVIILNK